MYMITCTYDDDDDEMPSLLHNMIYATLDDATRDILDEINASSFDITRATLYAVRDNVIDARASNAITYTIVRM